MTRPIGTGNPASSVPISDQEHNSTEIGPQHQRTSVSTETKSINASLSLEETSRQHPAIRKASISALQTNWKCQQASMADLKFTIMTPETLLTAIEEMESDKKAWELIPPGDKWGDEIDLRDWDRPQRTKGEIENQRRINGLQILQNMKIQLSPEYEENFNPELLFVLGVSNKDGNFEGLIHVSNDASDDPPEISNMVTLPGTKGKGGALIEQAVEQSVKWGKEGKLRAYPMSRDIREAFNKGLGFADEKNVPIEEDLKEDDDSSSEEEVFFGCTCLNPAESEKWAENGNSFKLCTGQKMT